MSNQGHSSESEDEFFEDFSGWRITDDDLENMLITARMNGDVRLRRLVKQNQYLRFLLDKILEAVDRNEDLQKNQLVDLARTALKANKETQI